MEHPDADRTRSTQRCGRYGSGTVRTVDPAAHRSLNDVLTQSRSLGFLGPGPLQPHLDNAWAFVQEVGSSERILDLGSGGGLPGLVVAGQLDANQELVLLDAMERRCRFLEQAVESLGLGHRVGVRCGRAEDLARDSGLRGTFDTVLSRSFGPPAVTAECAVGFLSGPGARVLVSEPPASDGARWDPAGLEELGLGIVGVRQYGEATLVCLEVTGTVSERFPRRSGVPAKRPLF